MLSGNNAPIIKDHLHDKDELTLSIFVPKELSCFDGHFPGNPVLPGVAQIDWVCQLGITQFNFVGFNSIQSVKYNGMILPETNAKLTLKAKGLELRFSYRNDKQTLSSGCITFSDRMQK